MINLINPDLIQKLNAHDAVCAVRYALLNVSEEDLVALDKQIGEAIDNLSPADSTKRLLALDKRTLLRICMFTRSELQTRLMSKDKAEKLQLQILKELIEKNLEPSLHTNHEQ